MIQNYLRFKAKEIRSIRVDRLYGHLKTQAFLRWSHRAELLIC